jgi:class 3 adenylate cyclase/tetratricopeptide (TPR) repeat protein
MSGSMDVASWLGALGLSTYAQVFRDNDIDISVLAALTADDLREIGVISVGHRRRILDAAALLRAPDPPEAVQSVAATLAPVPAAAMAEAERRHVTVMYCDLVDSTGLSTQVDPEDYREFIARYRAVLDEAIHPYRGYVAQYAGDGALICFGYPVSYERDAENAVDAALAIAQLVAAMPNFAGRQPCVRIGVATGFNVVSTADRAGDARGDSVYGETPNLAARLQTLATPNGVIVSSDTHELIGALFECADLGSFELKGFTQPVRAWQACRRRTTDRLESFRAARRSTVFIDRNAELARLRHRLATARAGRGQVAIIAGEGGLGKSRLARKIFEEVGTDTAVPPILHCTPNNIGTPFYPILYYIERVTGVDPHDPPDIALEKLAALLDRVEPTTPERLALLAELTHTGGADLTPLRGLAPPERRNRTMRMLLALMEAILRDTAVTIIEDIQWIDPSTAELIEKLLPTIRSLPILLIGTMRPGPFPAWLAKAEPRFIQLERLPHNEVRALIRAIAGDVDLVDSIVDAIAARSDGIPIYTEELTRGYVEAASDGQTGCDELSYIPATLVDSLMARLDRLKQGRRIASIGAVIGREFPIAVLVAISGLPETEVRAGIGELLEAEIFIMGHSSFGEAIAFRHFLVRDAAYQMLLRDERTALHARVAYTLTTMFPNIAQAVPHLIAVQLTGAGDFAGAAAAWDKAGMQAANRSAYSEAIGHFSKAIETNRRASDSRERDDRELTCRLNLVSALIAARGFASAGVTDEMEQAVALSRKLGATANLIPALTSKWIVTGSGGDCRASLELALQIRQAAETGSTIDRLLGHRTLGTSLLFGGQFRRAIEELEQFFALYDRDRDEAELRRVGPSNHAVFSMVGLAEIYTLFAQFRTADLWSRRALETAHAGSGSHTTCGATMFCGCLLPSLRGQDDVVARHAAELKALVVRHDLPYWRGHADLFAGLVSIRRGQTDEGFVEAKRGIKGLIAENAFLNGLFILYAEACEQAGRITEAMEMLDHAVPAMENGELWFAAEYRRIRARLLLARDRNADEGRKGLEIALRIAETQGAQLFAERIRRDLATLPELRRTSTSE